MRSCRDGRAAGDGPFPAVVLISGSGPHHRDETIGPDKPFRDLARGLARHSGGRPPDPRGQYSPLITKNEPRIVPASFDFCRANLNLPSSSAGTSMPSESLKPTARFLGSPTV